MWRWADAGIRLATTRVLGARIVAGGDPGRTWPRPGETALVTWVVAGPRPRSLAWSFRVTACTGGMDDDACSMDGAVVAADAPGTDSGRSDGTTPPALTVTAPVPAGAGPAVDRLMVNGVICAGGAVADVSAAPWSRCAATADDGPSPPDETDVRLTLRLQQGETGNAPPSLSGDVVTWGGEVWQSGSSDGNLSSSGGPCAADATVPQIVRADDDEHDVVVTIDAANRETIPSAASGPGATPPAREAAQVSAFATLGAFATQFGTVLAGDQRTATPLRFKWTSPSQSDAQLDGAGRLVRFVFVVRDGRGGLDATTRTLCLVPSAASSP